MLVCIALVQLYPARSDSNWLHTPNGAARYDHYVLQLNKLLHSPVLTRAVLNTVTRPPFFAISVWPIEMADPAQLLVSLVLPNIIGNWARNCSICSRHSSRLTMSPSLHGDRHLDSNWTETDVAYRPKVSLKSVCSVRTKYRSLVWARFKRVVNIADGDLLGLMILCGEIEKVNGRVETNKANFGAFITRQRFVLVDQLVGKN